MRLIDADEFLKRNEVYADCEFEHPKYQNTLREIVNEEPSVNAVEVVRCKDCKWWKEPYCVKNYVFIREADWFCADGEKRDQ